MLWAYLDKTHSEIRMIFSLLVKSKSGSSVELIGMLPPPPASFTGAMLQLDNFD